jgi:hypothetical protein
MGGKEVPERPITIDTICEDGKSAVDAADKIVNFGINDQTEPSALEEITELTERVLLNLQLTQK